MSLAARSYYLQNKPIFAGTPAKTLRKRSFTIPLIELVRPDGYWPQPLSIEQAFELLRHMMEKAGPQYDTPGRWGKSGVAELLIGRGIVSASGLYPITSLNHLRETFHRAILARPASQGQFDWRNDNGFNVTDMVTVKRAVYKPFDGARHLGFDSEADIKSALERLMFKSKGERMAIALNRIHKHTVDWLHGVSIGVSGKHGFTFILEYGCDPTEAGASRWDEVIARTRDKETFLDTMARARDVFDCLVLGKANGADTSDMFTFTDYSKSFILDQVAGLK